ncbi:MAG: hypothetical protein JXR97_11655 [Planctomycetes bacterium]|nr:hypothetical protein [Planctomycetota bacterium]
MLYHSQMLKLTETAVIDELGAISIDDLPDRSPKSSVRLKNPTPFMEKLWRCALYDVESNICRIDKGFYFAAGGRGKGWNGMVFTRDLGFSGILGLNRLYPQEMYDSIRTTREVRLSIGLRVDREHYHPDLPFEQEDLSEEEYKQKYGTNPYARRSDDVLWLWWAEDLFSQHFDTEENWTWLYETGNCCFEKLYNPFYNQETGLYKGQSSFVDIAGNGYPESFGLHTIKAKRNCLTIESSSTNCLYYKGMKIMASLAKRLGKEEEHGDWERRAEKLRNAIRVKLLHPDGTVSYFKHEDQHLEQRQHCLATAFAVICGVLDGEAARDAVKDYPVAWWGVPLIYPFFPNGKCYHNNSAWPFCDAFFLRAREKALGIDESARELALLARSCRGDTFHEWTNFHTKIPSGKSAQLWTIAPFIGRCCSMGLVDPATIA